MTNVASLLGHGIFLLAIILFVIQAKRWGKYFPFAYIIAAVLVVVPVSEWLVVEYSRGYFGDLSIATLLICGLSIIGQGKYSMQTSFKLFTLILAALLLPTAMGMGMFDSYSVGFPSHVLYPSLVAVLLVIGSLAWWFKAWQVFILIALSLFANALGLYETQNIWNYLLDPIVIVACISSFVYSGLQQVYFNYIKREQYAK